MNENINRENILEEIRCINDNNFSNSEHVNNIELMLVNENDSMLKDRDVSTVFTELKDKVDEISSTTSEILEYLGEDDQE